MKAQGLDVLSNASAACSKRRDAEYGHVTVRIYKEASWDHMMLISRT